MILRVDVVTHGVSQKSQEVHPVFRERCADNEAGVVVAKVVDLLMTLIVFMKQAGGRRVDAMIREAVEPVSPPAGEAWARFDAAADGAVAPFAEELRRPRP